MYDFPWDQAVFTIFQVNPLKIQRTAGGTPSGDRVKSSDTKTQKTSWTCHISTESWDSCDFDYVNHFKIQ